MKALTIAALLVVVSTAVACAPQGGTDAAGDSTANDTTGTKQGDEFLRCWSVSDGNTEDFFRTYTVSCHYSSAALAGLGRSFVAVDLRPADQSSAASAMMTDHADADFVVGRVYTKAFPLQLAIYGDWATGQGDSTAFRTSVTLATTSDASTPVSVKLPYQTWNVSIINKGQLAVVSTQGRTIDASPFFTDQDENSTKTTFTTSASSGVVRTDPGSLVLLTKGDAVPVQVQTEAGSFSAQIDGPGTYVVDGKTLTKSSDDAGAPPPAPGTDDAGAPPPDTTDDGGAPAPAATCGVAGLQHCVDNGSWTCVDGTRADVSSGVCTACGDDGQTYCVVDPHNVQGNWHCNTGTRLDSSTSTCVACGAAGQTHCVADPNNVQGNWSCNDGLNYDNNGICN